jgi:hypothetical protein
LQDFGDGAPRQFQIAAERLRLPAIVPPRFDRATVNRQFHAFVQDSLRVTPRFGLNAGVRYDHFGSPRNTGPLDTIFDPAHGALVENAGIEAYRADRNDWAARLGLFYDLGGRSQTVLRGGYGIFYDRPFGNLFQNTRNNNIDLALVSPTPPFPLTSPAGLQGRALNLLRVLWLDPNLRTPYVQSWFGGVQRQFNEDLYVEWSAQGALGRKLIGTDRGNRLTVAEPRSRPYPAIDDEIVYRSNFVSSSYNAMTALLRYRTPHAHFQAAYTWGHSIDNQSDPLQGTFEDLGAFRNFGSDTDNLASLTKVSDTRADRASSDFDQRHNLVFFSVWDLPFRNRRGWKGALLGDWRIAQIAGFRSGFPFNVIVSGDETLPRCAGMPVESELVRPRPSLLPGRDPWLETPVPVPGGFQLLNPAAFCDPGPSLGNLGRNALTGPGFWNVDFSLAKSFRPKWLGENGSIQLRADIFNLFNHANLGNPDGLLDFGERGTFGHALLGRQGAQPTFPSQTPLDQLPRQVQLQLKWIF